MVFLVELVAQQKFIMEIINGYWLDSVGIHLHHIMLIVISSDTSQIEVYVSQSAVASKTTD